MATAAIAGLGLDTIVSPGERYSFARLAPSVLLTLIAAAVLFLLANGLVRGILIVITVIIAFYLLIRTRWASATCAIILALLLFADLGRANLNRYRHPFADAPACFSRYMPAVDVARDQAIGARAAFSAAPLDTAMPANIGLLANLRTVGGRYIALTAEQRLWWDRLTGETNATEPADFSLFQTSATGAALLNFMCTRVITTVPGGPLNTGIWEGDSLSLRPARTVGDGKVYVNEKALPRAYWVPEVVTSGSLTETLDTLLDPAFDPNRAIVVDRHSPGLVTLGGEILALAKKTGMPPSTLSRTEATCAVEEESPERITVRIQSPAVGMLLLADTFAPGWIADVDGESRVVVRANGLFRAVHVPAGSHVVTFRYRPAPFYAGAAITATTLLLTTGAALIAVARRAWPRRRPVLPRLDVD
jgi:hypothetical protein